MSEDAAVARDYIRDYIEKRVAALREELKKLEAQYNAITGAIFELELALKDKPVDEIPKES